MSYSKHGIDVGFYESGLDYVQVAMDTFTKDEGARDLWSSSQVPLNRIQFEAIKNAIVNQFQLIQGPPGGFSTHDVCLLIVSSVARHW